jgi:flagellar biosynthesis/type III secretory pathway M-ring protein FliF/YscJ
VDTTPAHRKNIVGTQKMERNKKVVVVMVVVVVVMVVVVVVVVGKKGRKACGKREKDRKDRGK